jgi:hypothetical protein
MHVEEEERDNTRITATFFCSCGPLAHNRRHRRQDVTKPIVAR